MNNKTNYKQLLKSINKEIENWEQLTYKYEKMFSTIMEHWNELPHETRQSLNDKLNNIEVKYGKYQIINMKNNQLNK